MDSLSLKGKKSNKKFIQGNQIIKVVYTRNMCWQKKLIHPLCMNNNKDLNSLISGLSRNLALKQNLAPRTEKNDDSLNK